MARETRHLDPDDEMAEMQREEVHALEAIFDGALELRSSRQDEDFDFPIVYRIKLNEIDIDNRDIGNHTENGTTNWPNQPLTVEVRYPQNYPSDEEEKDTETSVPSFELLHENTVIEFPSFVSDKLLAVLRDTAESERGMPSVLSCLYAAREFLDGDRLWQDDTRNKKATGDLDYSSGVVKIKKSDTKYACISTHHLFDHKPDNILKTGHKYHLSGYYKYGTPGIAIAWGDMDSIDDFLDTMKRAMPQKKFELVFIQPWDMTKHDRVPTGWNSVDPPTLKEEMKKIDVPEEDYYIALGLQQINNKSCKGKSRNKK